MRLFTGIVLIAAFSGCQQRKNANFSEQVRDVPYIVGKPEYLNSPYVTAGNRVYMVGYQDGSFPDLGWHIQGEMGGIWDHPIKLMDGFDIELSDKSDALMLDKADQFTNYPFANKHTFFWNDKHLEIERWQFVPDNKQGLVIQLIIKNLGEERNIALKFTGTADLRPTWLGEQSNMIDGKDQATYDTERQIWKVKDSLNDWYTIFGAEVEDGENRKATENPTVNNTASGSIENTLLLPSGETRVVNYIISGSYSSEEEALNTYASIRDNLGTDFDKKRDRYKALAQRSRLTVPDKDIQQAFEWLKYNCDWLVRTVPEIGTGMMAGIPDYPWWFGVDSEYALKGFMAIGQSETVYSTIRLLDSLSNAVNGNGRIVHEVSTNGVVFNKGNINETPQFASLIWEIYQWNGDKEFLKTYFPTVQKGLDWVMTERDANRNLLPDGYGMMEIHGLDSEMIDVAAYTQRAFDDAAKMALELGDDTLSQKYKIKADMIKKKINTDFWSEEFGSFGDFLGTDQQAMRIIDDAIVRADTLHKPWAVEELRNTKAYILKHPSDGTRPFVIHHNWVVNTPMEMGIAEHEKALRGLATAEKFVNPFGVFVTGIDRDASAGSEVGSFKGSKAFSYTGAVMTLPTGVQAIAESNYGRPNQALDYIRRMSKTFSFAFPGSMYEVSPDYGMITQAWNVYGFAIPIVQHFFGIRPEAARRKIVIRPQMPDEWDKGSLENVIVSDNAISVFYQKAGGFLRLKVTQENPDWALEIVLPKEDNGTTYEVAESPVRTEVMDNEMIFHVSAATTEVVLKYEEDSRLK